MKRNLTLKLILANILSGFILAGAMFLSACGDSSTSTDIDQSESSSSAEELSSSEPVSSSESTASSSSEVAAHAVLQGSISADTVLTAKTEYELKDFVYVDAGATLTIPAGTVFKSGGKSALIVRRGGKIMAEGTADSPIVFTSKESVPVTGDWAGIVIFGKAPVSSTEETLAFEADENELFGGTDAADNSGILKYMRIEYAGFTVAEDKELNGLTLGGVGSGTVISHVQVHAGLDDAIEFFGGTVEVDHIVTSDQADDGFDIDEGFNGKGTYLLQVQGENSDHGIEAGSKARNASHITEPVFSKITIVANSSGAAVLLKDNVSGTYEKMVIVGDNTPVAVEVKGAVTLSKITEGSTLFTDTFLAGSFVVDILTDSDTTALATVEAQLNTVTVGVGDDYETLDADAAAADAGAVQADDIWIAGWTDNI